MSPRLALAEASSADREQARELAGQGYEALQRKDFVAAEDLFRRADALVHAPTLELDHARALVGLGKLVEANERCQQVIREGVAADAPWQWRMAVIEARTELAAVNRRMAWLTIRVRGGHSRVVEIDGKTVPNAALGVRRATNPGLRVVSARADGYLPKQQSITLEEGQSAELELTLEPDPNAAVPAAAPPPPPPVVVPPPAPAPVAGPDRTLPIVLLSVGGAALAAGAITGVLTLGVRTDLRRSCSGGVCVPMNDREYSDYHHQLDKYRTLGTTSGVALAVGAGSVLTGAALLLFSGKPHSDARARRAGTAQASLHLGFGSLYLTGAF